MSSHTMPATRRRLPYFLTFLFVMLSVLVFLNGTRRGAASPAPGASQTPSPSPSQSSGTCFAPQPITGAGLFSFNNTNTPTSNQGQTSAACNFEGDPRIEHDTWYRWTASCTGPITIQTCGLTSVDTKLAVYKTSPCAQPAPTTTEGFENVAAEPLAGCNDDECGSQSSVMFQAVAGSQYLIQLGTAPNTAGGTGQFRITCDPPPKVACCLPGQSCQNITAAECLDRGGTSSGPGSSCADSIARLRPANANQENIVPLVWQPKHQNWNLDTNGNFVEDEIEQMSQGIRINILIALNRVPDNDDLARFGQFGTVGYVGRYIPVVQLKQVLVFQAIGLGADGHVAHVQLDHQVFPTTDISMQAIRVQDSAFYNPSTLEAACPFLDGSPVNIAIIDSGVDDGVHVSLPASSFLSGYDFTTNTAGNPDDNIGHGTHVAGIALGRKFGAFRGVALTSRLIDLKVFDPGFLTTEATVEAALDRCIFLNTVSDLNIGVINMSLGNCKNSDGGDTLSQHVNNVVKAGTSVVVSMGNSPNCGVTPGTNLVPSPAAADRAITVQAASYQNNVDRGNDAIASTFFLRGPRLADADANVIDELKPDVTAHGTNSNSGSGAGVLSAEANTLIGYVRKPGTSMAAPHVTGLAALLVDGKGGVNTIGLPAVIKDLILNTAEHRGSTPGWQTDWGYGLIDGFAACEALTHSLQTDLQFKENCGSPNPLSWTSSDLFAGNPVIIEGIENTINAKIHNAGPNTSGPFKVYLGVYEFGTSPSDNEICTVEVPGLSPNQTITVSCPWIPDVDGNSGVVHACLKAYIINPPDTDISNDCAQRNVSIKATQSPANFKFNVVNPTNEDLTIRLVHDLNVCASNGWTIRFPTPTFLLRAGERPRTVEALLDPGAQTTGAQKVAVTAVGVRADGTELSLGGVTLVAQIPGFADCNHNGVADSMDIQLGYSKDQDHDNVPDECMLCPSKTITVNPATLVNQTWGVNADYPPLNLTPTGGTAPYSFAVTGGALPLGMVVDPYGKLNGKPLTLGIFTFQVTATDADGCKGVRQYQLAITSCPAITMNPAAGALPTARFNTAYNQTFTATGACASSFNFSVASGALPPGLTLSTGGLLSGTPTQKGDFTFTVTSTDSCGCSKSETYTLKVDCPKPPGCPLVISRFRENGPAGAADEFVEIFNSGNSPVIVSACSNDPGGSSLGIGVFASSGNGPTTNRVSLVCRIPGNTVIAGRGYYLCGGKDYSLGRLGGNGGTAHATPDQTIGTDGAAIADIASDAGLSLLSVGSNIVTQYPVGTFGGCSGFSFSNPGIGSGDAAVYDKVGFGPYGAGSPLNIGSGYPDNIYPSLAGQYCEGTCLQPVGDASLPGACFNPSGLFAVDKVGPACYGQSGQYEFLRRQTAFGASFGTLHRDTVNNADDFILVSPNSALNLGQAITGISGVTSVLGAAGPQGSAAPPDTPVASLTRAPFDVGSQLGPRNAERNYAVDPTIVNPTNDPQGTFSLRFLYTNNSGRKITGLRFRVDNVSTLCGPQTAPSTVGTGDARNVSSSTDCGTGSFTAILKLLNSATEVVVDSTGTARIVSGTVMEDLSRSLTPPVPPITGPLSPLGGGVDNSIIVGHSDGGGIVQGHADQTGFVGDGVTDGRGSFNTTMATSGPTSVLRVRVKFGVVSGGRFILLITPMAQFSPAPALNN